MSAWSRKNLWDRTPSPVKRAMGFALRRVPPQWLLGRAFRRQLALARESQGWDEERIRAFQLDKLRTMLHRAVLHSPYYQRLFASVGLTARDAANLSSIDLVARLPTINKETIRAHRDDLCTVGPTRRGVDYVSTGGSSGVPVGMYMNAGRSATEYAHLVASWERAGYRMAMSQAVFRGQVIGSTGASDDASAFRHAYDPILRRHSYSNFHMTDEDIRRYLAHVATLGPCFLHVYPSSVAALARYLRRSGEPAPCNIRGILAGSETVYPEERAAAEAAFGVRYFSWYGHTEKLILAAECEQSTDYHIWPTYGYLELLDESGRPVTQAGERGEIVGTGFINTVMPLIRYRTGDYATYIGDSCRACGRWHTILREIRGHRTGELLVAADGTLISWTAVNMHDDTFDRVRQFQFRQSAAGRAVLRVVASDGFGESDRRRIRASLERKLGGRLEIEMELCESIPLTHRGKSTFVDQRLDLAEFGVGQVPEPGAMEAATRR